MGAVSSAFKGLTGGSGLFGSLLKPVTKLLGDVTGANAAIDASRRLSESLSAQQTEAANLQRNLNADLRNTEVADVQVGGSADAMDALKRRRKAGGLASTLGL